MDLFRRVVRHILNVHAAFGGGDESHPPACAINQQSQIEFLGDIHAVSHIKAVDLLARFSGLHRNEGVAQHRSEEHTSELQSLMRISYAVFCLKKKKTEN